MCSSCKFVGGIALWFSLFYNTFLLVAVFTLLYRCYDDCHISPSGEFPKDCNSTYSIYALYLPTVFAAPFIIATDRSSIYYLQSWLLIHAVLTVNSYFLHNCYCPFYTAKTSDINILGIASLIFSLGLVAFHYFTVMSTPEVKPDENSTELTA